MTTTVRAHPWAAAITGVYVLLAVIYSLVTPIFEASDEISHYPVVEHIATSGRLPVQQPGVRTLWEQEGSQPPLYYLVAAGLTFWIDTSDLEARQWRNPHAKLGVTLDPDNKNMIIHTEAERFPWHGTVLAVHLIRFFGVVLGAFTVTLTFVLAREIVPDYTWVSVLAAALVAFNPMFLFITGSVNNDNLTIALSTWTMLICVRILKDGYSPLRIGLVAVLTALATITKISGLTLIPLVGITLLIRSWRHLEWRLAILTGGALIVSWLLLASWWYIRNLTLYGELLGLQTHVAIAGSRSIDIWSLITNEWYAFWVSYWALFGAVNILVGQEIYLLYGVLCLAALIGLVLWVRTQIAQREWSVLLIVSVLGLYTLGVLMGVIRWTMTTYASQGRLMFPAIAPISVAMALGIVNLEVQPWRQYAAIATTVILALIAALIPFTYIAPAYTAPKTVTSIPITATPVQADFEGLRLLAVESPLVTLYEGDRVPITLYWQAESALTRDYSIFLHVFGRSLEEIGKIDSYPGGGVLPTTRMQPGALIEDSYWIELDDDFEAPAALRIQVGVGIYTDRDFASLTPIVEGGQTPTSIMVDAGVAYPREGCPLLRASRMALARFGGFAEMWSEPLAAQAVPGDDVAITLIWDRLSDTSLNWTVFVQMVDINGNIVAQADGPPMEGSYPTSLWRQPCQIADVHVLTVPSSIRPGNYEVIVGLYDANNPTYPRAEAVGRDGTVYPDSAVSLGMIRVVQP